MDAQKCDLCRICLGPINGRDEVLLNNNHFLMESIFLITGLKVVSNSEQCEYLCSQCHSSLEQCIEFRLTCINNDDIYREMMIGSNHVEDYKSDHQKPVIEYVKQEPVDLGEPIDDVTQSFENNHMFLHEVIEPSVERKEEPKNDSDDDIAISEYKKTHSRKLHCQQCDNMVDYHNLEEHMTMHHPNRIQHCCPLCPKKYMWPYDLKRHIEEHHTRKIRYPCDKCGKFYVNRDSLKEHYRAVHNGEKRYACKICGERFTRGSVRSYHQRWSHSTARPSVCQYCNKTFKSKNNLTRHIRKSCPKKPWEPK